jgi:hypothetical protein
MIQPTIFNLSFIGILLFVFRYIVLEISPAMIINGYFALYVTFTILTYIFTNDILLSHSLSLMFILIRSIYRYISKQDSDYNSTKNVLLFLFAILSWTIIVIQYTKIERYIKKYSPLFSTLIMGSLLLMLDNSVNKNLLCLS